MKKLGFGIVLALSSIALPAYADDAAPPTAQPAQPNLRGAIKFPELIITGKRSVPVASASILRVEPAITLTELRISLLAKVEKVILGDHF
jgi:hypothetical protein